MTKLIPLSQGAFTIVDDGDYEYLNQWVWSQLNDKYTIYACRCSWKNGKSKTIRLHRFLLDAPKDMDVDHIDSNGLNNTRKNLRICTRTENQYNMRKPKTHAGQPTSSEYKGVCWHEPRNKWKSQIQSNGKKKFLGYFHSEVEAARTYDLWARKLYGDFARTNFT